MKELLNKIIYKIYISNDKRYLSFQTNDGEINFFAYGDCCSESWFNHICGIHPYLINANKCYGQVKSIEQTSDFKTLPSTKQDVDQICFTKIRTQHCYIDIELRNSSNGYYNGSIDYDKRSRSQIEKDKKVTFSELKEDF
jgi:hypothetical protein